ncbi:uncharacterized protein K460DRAFT_377012 [Cucurbitaria berberidis CBS 394.84]|uniref:DSBA-like thioredoxin domain-containing protein n=1 Tax=Cucurbitaria berberidis CBS 394.84 TaxID=1168544 RepID=A0A9P4GHQ6_9PLEO|nr:uncharacterized protein K460DRAFT_377012 [Cucurbitaria berberidis CBS 394.84]KAF1845641.1 hypothetical protein K460DRAFT_377012 [Cucurbitaria berberidis CBS 394.84]
MSPFAYRTPRFSSNAKSRTLPIFLAGLMHACGNNTPISITSSSPFLTRAAYFPNNTLSIQRTLVALSLSHPQSLPRAISLFYENFWAHWNGLINPENIQATVRTIVGCDEKAQKVIERTKSVGVKKILTERRRGKAFATDAKGEKECLWGFDHMGRLCDHLSLERPSDKG